ncbi:hypothetical protein DSM106972_027310 [Dulcicalothrix desertica PCC 7102]|uniref:Uncharacterized protein n=1 Tax=Dulcicalothrix desertica PCC 7102 TaxID=232991 RepID=A0A3S1APS2_9CYAN|nr:hypothetical protein [Dulcicalothrix desertica]RUT06474.1 hypothetical protein DSM106972_027310 [Dulcicalothrix desertica PCC 7102]TWH62635.1 hypothetical protein CAL7102_00134 [Dulcicalothrix desertica PCC 7102]
MYVLQVTLQDEIAFAYEGTTKGKKCFKFPASLFHAKVYKSRKGAEKACDKFKTENGACQDIIDISIREVTQEDIEQSIIDSVNRYLKSELESLNRECQANLSVSKIMKYKLAWMLVNLKQNDLVYHCAYTTTGWKCKIVEIEEIKYSSLKVKDTYYKRIYGTPEMKKLPIHGILERVLPCNDEIVNYFTKLTPLQSLLSDNFNIDQYRKLDKY